MVEQLGFLKGLWEKVKPIITFRAMLVEHEKRLAAVEKRLGEQMPANPRDVKFLYEMYWGIPEGGDKRQPYCPLCWAEGKWVPLPRWRHADNRLYCRACRQFDRFIRPEEEAEAQEGAGHADAGSKS